VEGSGPFGLWLNPFGPGDAVRGSGLCTVGLLGVVTLGVVTRRVSGTPGRCLAAQGGCSTKRFKGFLETRPLLCCPPPGGGGEHWV